MPEEIHEGGCVCGAVRYRCTGAPQAVIHCFCTDCQRTSGGRMSTNAVYPASAVSLTAGSPRALRTRGDSGGTVRRVFRGDCGSPLISEPEVMPDVSIVKVGTFDDPSPMTPTASIYTASAPPWAVIPDGLPAFPGMPPAA